MLHYFFSCLEIRALGLSLDRRGGMDGTVQGTAAACVLPSHRHHTAHYPGWYHTPTATHQIAHHPQSSFLHFGGQASQMVTTNQPNSSPMYNLHSQYPYHTVGAAGSAGPPRMPMAHGFISGPHPASFASSAGSESAAQLGTVGGHMNFPAIMFNVDRGAEGIGCVLPLYFYF